MLKGMLKGWSVSAYVSARVFAISSEFDVVLCCVVVRFCMYEDLFDPRIWFILFHIVLVGAWLLIEPTKFLQDSFLLFLTVLRARHLSLLYVILLSSVGCFFNTLKACLAFFIFVSQSVFHHGVCFEELLEIGLVFGIVLEAASCIRFVNCSTIRSTSCMSSGVVVRVFSSVILDEIIFLNSVQLARFSFHLGGSVLFGLCCVVLGGFGFERLINRGKWSLSLGSSKTSSSHAWVKLLVHMQRSMALRVPFAMFMCVGWLEFSMQRFCKSTSDSIAAPLASFLFEPHSVL